MGRLWTIYSLFRPSRLIALLCLFLLLLSLASDLKHRISPSHIGRLFGLQSASNSGTLSNADSWLDTIAFTNSALAAPTPLDAKHSPSLIDLHAPSPSDASAQAASTAMSSSTAYSLSPDLASKKKQALDRLGQPEAQDASKSPLVLIMGNEAGDTDSLASAVLLCHFLSNSPDNEYAKQFDKSTLFVPLVQQHRSDLPLRAENEFLFSLMQLSPDNVLFLDDLPDLQALQQRTDVKLGLTDHPKLSSYWTPYQYFEKQVVVVVDHHADDGAHKDAAVRVLMGPENGAVASDVSVVVNMFKNEKSFAELPAPLANLGLAAILIDTDDLRPMPKGKATKIDLEAADMLLQRSTLASSEGRAFVQTAVQQSGIDTQELDVFVNYDLANQGDTLVTQNTTSDVRKSATLFFEMLSQKKLDVSRLNTRDLLRRDYKENVAHLDGDGNRTMRAGFSSVPVGLSDWVHDRYGDGEDRWTGYWQALRDWMGERQLDVAVVGTSFREFDEKSGKLEERLKSHKHRRELIFAYAHREQQGSAAAAAAASVDLFANIKQTLQADGYATSVGNEASQKLLLEEPWKGRRIASTGKRERIGGLENDGKFALTATASQAAGGVEMWIAVWRQQNAKASRKVYLPAVMYALKAAAR